MLTLNDVHQQFASFFDSRTLQPYANSLSKKLAEGHICINLAEDFGDKQVDDLSHEPLIGSEQDLIKPFILHNRRLYLQRYFKYESTILYKILNLIDSGKVRETERIELLQERKALVATLFQRATTHERSDPGQTDWQLIAALSALLNNFCIITGGPGTGKTTTVSKVLAILFSMDANLKVALAAPTGKAASRMAESLKIASQKYGEETAQAFTSLHPSTIHRLLKGIPDSLYFQHTKENPLDYDVIILDESSMIDTALFAKVLDAIGPQTRLILLGDKDQLASIEAGSLFGDLCEATNAVNRFSTQRLNHLNSLSPDRRSYHLDDSFLASEPIHPLAEHIIELQYSHRFNDLEGIGRFSKAIITNDEVTIKNFLHSDTDEQLQIDSRYSQPVLEEFIKGYGAYISEPDIKIALRKLNDLRILTAIREGEQGLNALNRKVEKFLSDRGLISIKSEHYENRPIILTGNNYALGLFNGDIGIIRKDESGISKAWFEDSSGELKSVLPGLISKAETVYAMTIHKSQGSEFDKVLLILPQVDTIQLLTRELLYTGITRARSKVILQGSESLILTAASARVKRASGISERFLMQTKIAD